MKRPLILSAVILSLAVVVSAQESLGEAARRLKKGKVTTEQEGKQATKPARVYTNENMPSRGAVGSAATAKTAAVNSKEEAKKQKQENNWKCEKTGLKWVPDPEKADGGYCATEEQAYATAMRRCRDASGTWKEVMDLGSRGGVRGWCTFAKPAEVKKPQP